jgi:hypothetical protein
MLRFPWPDTENPVDERFNPEKPVGFDSRERRKAYQILTRFATRTNTGISSGSKAATSSKICRSSSGGSIGSMDMNSECGVWGGGSKKLWHCHGRHMLAVRIPRTLRCIRVIRWLFDRAQLLATTKNSGAKTEGPECYNLRWMHLATCEEPRRLQITAKF